MAILSEATASSTDRSLERRTAVLVRALARIALVVVLCLSVARADSPVSEDQVKAAFVYNFAKFIEWPAGTFGDPGASIVVGVVGDGHFGEMLDATLKDKSVQGRAMAVRHFAPGRMERCQILVITDADSAPDVLPHFGGSPTLTVGAGAAFTRAGGMITFAVEDRRVRFDVNLEALRKAQLEPSSQLLKVARIVQGARAEEPAP